MRALSRFSTGDVPSGREAVVKRWLFVICWCCIKKWLGPATEWKVDPSWFCIQAFELQVRRKKKTQNTEDVGQNRGTTLDQGEDTQRGTESTL